MKVNDELLSAYLDNELDIDLRLKVERELIVSPTLQTRLDQLQQADKSAKHYFKQLDAVPLSPTLQKLLTDIDPKGRQINHTNTSTRKILFLSKVKSTFKPVLNSTWALSLAASALLVIGSVLWWDKLETPTMDVNSLADANGLIPTTHPLYDLLEHTSSGKTLVLNSAASLQGVVVLTFATQASHPCREFTLQNAISATRNVACRNDNKQWQMQISIATTSNNPNSFVPASDDALKAIDDVINALSDGRVLNASEEKNWLDNAWEN